MRRLIMWLERHFIGFIQVTILWCIITSAIPLMYFWFRSDEVTIVDHIYFVMSFGREVLLTTALFLTIDKGLRWLVWPVLIYFTIVFIWQIIAIITAWDINHPKAVIVIFSALLTGVIMLLRKDLIHRSNGQ